MTHLRIAAVQLDFQPSTPTAGYLRFQEPLSPSDPLAVYPHPEYALNVLKNIQGCREVCDGLLMGTHRRYTANFARKLQEVLNYCYSNGVNLVVLPEYAVPVEALQELLRYSTKMSIVAGLGYMRRSDLTRLEGLNFNVEGVRVGHNVAAVMSPDEKNFLIAKKNRAQDENIVVGQGPRTEPVQILGGEKRIGVAICLDFLNESNFFFQSDADIVAIPALSKNTQPFYDTPRGFVRVFANHASYGGTFIGIPGLLDRDYGNQNGTTPLDRGVEGIVIVDWDSRQTFVEAPKSLRATDHKVFAVAGLIYSGREPQLAMSQKRMEHITSDDVLRVDSVMHHASSYLRTLDANRSEHLLPIRSLGILLDRQDSIQDDDILFLTRHCILSDGILTNEELQYLQCIDVARKLKDAQEHVFRPELLAAPYAEYEKNAREISRRIRVGLLEVRHKGPAVIDEKSQTTEEPQLVIFARLGAYSDESIKSLPRQLTLLRTIADMQDPSLRLHYRIFTEKDPSGMMLAFFDVICTARGKSQAEIESFREGLGQVIHIAFTGAYSIAYTTGDELLFNVAESVRRSVEWWTELRISNDSVAASLNIPDWGMVVDLLRSLSEPVVIELQCSALPFAAEIDHDTTAVGGQMADGENSVNSIFSELLSKEGKDKRRLQLRVFLGSKAPLAPSVISSIGIEMAGANPFRILESSNPLDVSYRSDVDLPRYSPVLALTIFHPPFGDIYATARRKREALLIPTNETAFPTGIVVGTSHVRHVRADEEIEIRISDDDRLRHTYVIGKTGSGKTNLLKFMAAQDVQVPGRGVTIIDPHGDLVDYVLRQVPQSRAEEVILIDLTRTDALPVLNPLSLGRNRDNVTIRDRTIQELILLLKSRIYHQYTGPRFEEIVRLVFESMLDSGYPVPASFIEVSGLLMDRKLQRDIERLIDDPELKKRWSFQDTLAKDNEYGGVMHWITSKFADISRDSTLRCVMGGAESTLSIEEIVNSGGILLVRIPEAVIGKQAADFIGSLILLQLRMAIIRRREFGKLQHHHFVYVDEFQNFANTDFHTVVAEARKFNIGFTLAHQNLEQLREFRSYSGTHEQRLINAILGNVGNIVVFGVGAIDAEFLSRQIGVDAKNIMKIGRFQALAKVLVNGYDTDAFTLRTREAIRLESPRVVEFVEERMKGKYWVDPQAVYAEINTRLQRISESAENSRIGRQTPKATDSRSEEDPLAVLEGILSESRRTREEGTPASTVDGNSDGVSDAGAKEEKDSLDDVNMFWAMGSERIQDDEQEKTLDMLQDVIWQDFLEGDTKLILTSDEQEQLEILLREIRYKSLSEAAEELEPVVEFLTKLIPDLEDILLEKALRLKSELLKERVSILRTRFAASDDSLTALSLAEVELDSGHYRRAIALLNEIQDSGVDIALAISNLSNWKDGRTDA